MLLSVLENIDADNPQSIAIPAKDCHDCLKSLQNLCREFGLEVANRLGVDLDACRKDIHIAELAFRVSGTHISDSQEEFEVVLGYCEQGGDVKSVREPILESLHCLIGNLNECK